MGLTSAMTTSLNGLSLNEQSIDVIGNNIANSNTTGFKSGRVTFNEMLTQMEAFEGLFIASTNLVNSLDAASLRRFDFKVKFDFLRPAQRIALFRRVLGNNVEPDELTLRRLAQLDQLVPGDFANVLRQFRALGMEPTSARLIEGLEGEIQLKPGAGVRRIGFR